MTMLANERAAPLEAVWAPQKPGVRIEPVEARSQRRLRIAVLICAIVVVSVLHYSTPTSYVWLHPLYQRAYYIPILLMALWFGWRGGLVAATIAGVTYIPHIMMAWGANPEYSSAQYVEIGMFFVIAALTGVLADVERKQRHKIEETVTKLAETYAQLQSSIEQLRRADRLSALGELSAGLAHEIRNPLGALEGAVQILQRSELPPPTRREFAEMAAKEVERLKVLLTHFLDFARPRPPRRTLMEPHLLLESVAHLASETARMANIHIRVEAADTARVAIDAEQIKQVLLNLVLNAVQAMPAGGQITLRSRQEDRSVLLEVSDQGSGIPAEDLERIFDPFFTTRAEGTGLGLSIAHQIVHGHGGEITAGNNLDCGATLSIVLPLAPSPAETKSAVGLRT
jgi:two-component system, NtrC family, sensor histidine kinase HydH